ncbi:DUF6151 family protein [Halomonas sabkhae]|uniref:GFA family protein n=1 Tax=Halomonas sabkhae TaxID=626223 RepID=UPI0025B4F673|nr:DUF6151 family protein [Halomonas sabkhae]MDN3525940.1 DUF6151 family protein [Halomonas sabkhae]
MSRTTVSISRCTCGAVELEVTGSPILGAACHCDDCQAGARQVEQLDNAPSILDAAGGTPYLLYRKDRVRCPRGDENLVEYKLKSTSPTSRIVAGCCNTFMYLDFQRGHWLSMHRAQFVDASWPLQVRIQTRFKPEGSTMPDNVPAYSAYPFKLIGKLVAARLAMLFKR